MSENLYCPDQKTLSEEGRKNYDRIFQKGDKDVYTVRKQGTGRKTTRRDDD